MKNYTFVLFVLCFLMSKDLLSQKYFTRDGHISFSSEAPLESILATNDKAASVIDVESGRIEFAVLIKAFQFKKALMQEHFNENYMESSKYPKATFKGKIENISKVDFGQDGNYEVTVDGDMTIHGVTNAFNTSATINVNDGVISAQAQFVAEVASYAIKIPGVVRENIAKEVEITLEAEYQPMTK